MPAARITSVGCYTPPGVLTNHDLSQMVETSDEWILERTGISTRHIAAPDVATSDMAIEAAKCCLSRVNVDPAELDAILLCTVTPDHMFPSTVCIVQHKLGAKRAWGFDLIAACSGFVYGLTTAANFVMAGTHKKVLVIGADTMSRIIDYKDRTTCVLFGDGAGAMLVEPGEEGTGFLAFTNVVDGSGADALKMPAGGSRMPPTAETVAQRLHYVKQDGQAVFKYAVRNMFERATECLNKAGIKAEDVKLLIPHQANQRIIKAVADRLGMQDRVMLNIAEYGNTTAATIPLATKDALDQGKVKKGDIVMFAAVGAGYTVGANLWRWDY